MDEKIPDNTETNSNTKSEQKKTKIGTKLLLVLIFILVCAISTLAAVCYKLYNDKQQEQLVKTNKEKVAGASILITDDSKDYLNEIKDKVQEGMICVKMTQNWVFKEGGASSNAYLANSEYNTFDLRFEIRLADTGEVIMLSPDVPVGSCIENFPLSIYMEPGQYDVIISHQQIKNGEVANSVDTAGKITVTD